MTFMITKCASRESLVSALNDLKFSTLNPASIFISCPPQEDIVPDSDGPFPV